MANFSKLLAVLTFVAGAQAQAYLVFPPGNYRSDDGCKMEIRRASNGDTSVRIDKGAGYIQADFRTMIVSGPHSIVSLNTCSGIPQEMPYAGEIPGSPVAFKVVRDDNQVTTYLTRCGGRFKPQDIRIEWDISKTDGNLVAIRSQILIAKYGLPNGWHSGPLKTDLYPLQCGRFSKIN
ncbi:MAG TPA: hypothetical protein VFV50_09320 [Bdellovibrionales bacterium]|nr:hypothetical protein [Bdellovibrionales bacterium]